MIVRFALEPWTPLELRAGEAHVWLADPALATVYASALEPLLSPAEREQQRAFVFERNRSEYLMAHGMLRLTLSRYAPIEPAAWEFVNGPYGRPEIAGPCLSPVRFSLSHSRGLVALAVSHTVPIGIDVEDTRRDVDVLSLAQSYFAPAEICMLRSLVGEQRRQRFFEYWTLKEAYVKARGFGLSLPLDRFSFEMPPDGEPRISFSADLRDSPLDWRFSRYRPTDDHCLALAVRMLDSPRE